MISITKKCDKCKRDKDSRLFCIFPNDNICRNCFAELKYLPTKPVSCDIHRDRYVYLICGAGFTKIGIADNVRYRIKQFRTGSPVHLEIRHYFVSRDALADELYLHCKYDDKRVHGEWFSLSDQDIENIKQEFPA